MRFFLSRFPGGMVQTYSNIAGIVKSQAHYDKLKNILDTLRAASHITQAEHEAILVSADRNLSWNTLNLPAIAEWFGIVLPTPAPTTVAPTTIAPTTLAPTTVASTTVAPTTLVATTPSTTTTTLGAGSLFASLTMILVCAFVKASF